MKGPLPHSFFAHVANEPITPDTIQVDLEETIRYCTAQGWDFEELLARARAADGTDAFTQAREAARGNLSAMAAIASDGGDEPLARMLTTWASSLAHWKVTTEVEVQPGVRRRR